MEKVEEHSFLEYHGQLTGDIRVQLLDLLKSITTSAPPNPNRKKLIGIALELLDNAQRYNASDRIGFSWRTEGNMLVITIRNLADEENACRLLRSMEMMESKTPEQIDDMFRDQLVNKEFGAKGGAGLGLLQIARKVGRGVSAKVEQLVKGQYLCTSIVRTAL